MYSHMPNSRSNLENVLASDHHFGRSRDAGVSSRGGVAVLRPTWLAHDVNCAATSRLPLPSTGSSDSRATGGKGIPLMPTHLSPTTSSSFAFQTVPSKRASTEVPQRLPIKCDGDGHPPHRRASEPLSALPRAAQQNSSEEEAPPKPVVKNGSSARNAIVERWAAALPSTQSTISPSMSLRGYVVHTDDTHGSHSSSSARDRSQHPPGLVIPTSTVALYRSSARRSSPVTMTPERLCLSPSAISDGHTGEEDTTPLYNSHQRMGWLQVATHGVAPSPSFGSFHRRRTSVPRVISTDSLNTDAGSACSTATVATTTSSAAHADPHDRHDGGSHLQNAVEVAALSSARSSLSRRVHFNLDPPAEADLSSTGALRCYGDEPVGASPLAPLAGTEAIPVITSTVIELPLVSSAHNVRRPGHGTPSNVHSGPHSATPAALERKTLMTSPCVTTPLPSSSRGTLGFALRLNKDGSIQPVPTAAPSKSLQLSGGNGGRTAAGTEVAHAQIGLPHLLGLPGLVAVGAGAASATYGATYQPGQPLPKPALKQVSRYSGDSSTSTSHADAATPRETGNDLSWRRNSNANLGGSRAVSSVTPPSSNMALAGQAFVSYVRTALKQRQQTRAAQAGAPVMNRPLPSSSVDSVPPAGVVATAVDVLSAPPLFVTPPVRSGSTRQHGQNLWLAFYWSLLGFVALASAMIILTATATD